jgi:hypothetical protein
MSYLGVRPSNWSSSGGSAINWSNELIPAGSMIGPWLSVATGATGASAGAPVSEKPGAGARGLAPSAARPKWWAARGALKPRCWAARQAWCARRGGAVKPRRQQRSGPPCASAAAPVSPATPAISAAHTENLGFMASP